MSFSVQPSALLASADSMSTIDVRTGASLRPSTDAAKAHGDWQAAAALNTCVANWTERLNQLSGELKATVQNLRSNAAGYTAADQTTISAMQDIATTLGE